MLSVRYTCSSEPCIIIVGYHPLITVEGLTLEAVGFRIQTLNPVNPQQLRQIRQLGTQAEPDRRGGDSVQPGGLRICQKLTWRVGGLTTSLCYRVIP